jgi:hypothetical protein
MEKSKKDHPPPIQAGNDPFFENSLCSCILGQRAKLKKLKDSPFKTIFLITRYCCLEHFFSP